MKRVVAMVAMLGLVGPGALWMACGDSESQGSPGGTGGGGGTDGGGPRMGAVVWRPCNIGQAQIDCATVDVPLDWSSTESQRIDYFVRRILTPSAPSKGQVWLLVGGPGTSGAGVLGGVSIFANLGWDVYVPDYRGVGASSSLSCGGEVGDVPHQGCMKELADRYGDDIVHFSTTAAALDMGHFIEAVHKPGEKVFVFGGSYGAFLGNRYLNLFPGQADGAIFGGLCPPAGCSLRVGKNVERAAQLVLTKCGADEFCSSKLGEDPWEKLGDVYAKIEAGHCSELGPNRAEGLSSVLAATIARRELMPAALAAIHRMDRCTQSDVRAIASIGSLFAPGRFDDSHGELQSSGFLYWNITLSEFWEKGLTVEALMEEEADLRIHSMIGSYVSTWKNAWRWPLYEPAEELKRWAPVSIPLLLMNGEVDAQTPIWDLDGIDEVVSAPGQHFVAFPMSGHGSHHAACGQELMRQFMRDPQAALDLGCADDLRILDFRGTSELARSVMGVDDLWDDAAGAFGTFSGTDALDPDLARAIEEARLFASRWWKR